MLLGRECQRIRWLGWSSLSTVSHSTVLPRGPFMTQWEISPFSVTDSRCSMNCGRFSKLRQKRYRSSAGLLIVTERSTLIVALLWSRNPAKIRATPAPAKPAPLQDFRVMPKMARAAPANSALLCWKSDDLNLSRRTCAPFIGRSPFLDVYLG